jgi:hypothetical protein
VIDPRFKSDNFEGDEIEEEEGEEENYEPEYRYDLDPAYNPEEDVYFEERYYHGEEPMLYALAQDEEEIKQPEPTPP